MTQAELGERIGLSFRAVSAAERTWDRTDGKGRVFDADLIVALAQELGIPIPGMFMPPADDGISKRYEYHPAPGDCSDMAALASLLLSDPSDDDTPVMQEYRERYAATIARYFDPERGQQLMAATGDLSSAELRAIRLERLQWQRGALAAMVDDIDQMVDAIVDLPRKPGRAD